MILMVEVRRRGDVPVMGWGECLRRRRRCHRGKNTSGGASSSVLGRFVVGGVVGRGKDER